MTSAASTASLQEAATFSPRTLNGSAFERVRLNTVTDLPL
jgi:hypothetical protein